MAGGVYNKTNTVIIIAMTHKMAEEINERICYGMTTVFLIISFLFCA